MTDIMKTMIIKEADTVCAYDSAENTYLCLKGGRYYWWVQYEDDSRLVPLRISFDKIEMVHLVDIDGNSLQIPSTVSLHLFAYPHTLWFVKMDSNGPDHRSAVPFIEKNNITGLKT